MKEVLASGNGAKAAARSGQPSLKGRALRLLSMREHSRAELARKLAPFAMPDDDLESMLAGLVAQGWISDERVAHSHVNRRAARLGVARVRQELLAKGVSSEVVSAAVEELQASELARAANVWQKKFGIAPADARERARQGRFLLGRGFGASTVNAVLARAADILLGEWPPSSDWNG